jgi:uncharacterized membrane protein YgcG
MKLRLLVATVALLIFPANASAAVTGCDLTVYDGASVLDSDSKASLESSVQKLTRAGAEVRVRTETNTGTGNLDKYQRTLEKACSSWQDAAGGRKNNLITMIISIQERKTGLYYGSQWEGKLDGIWTGLQAERMNPRFRDGEFGAGLKAGIDGVHDAVTGVTPVQSGEPTEPREPVDWSPVVSFFKYVLAALAGIGALFLSYTGITRYRAKRRELMVARQELSNLAQVSVNKVLEVNNQHTNADMAIQGLREDMVAEEFATLEQAYKDTEDEISRMSELFENLNSDMIPKMKIEECEQTKLVYEEILANADKALAELQLLMEQAQELEGFQTEFHSRSEACDKNENELKETFQSLRSQGLTVLTPYENGLTEADALQNQSKDAYQNKRLTRAIELMESAEQSLNQVIAAAKQLPARVDGIRAENERLRNQYLQRNDEGKTTIENTLNTLNIEHPVSAYNHVADAVSDSNSLLSDYNTTLEQLETALFEQDWDLCESLIHDASQSLDNHITLEVEVVDLLQRIVSAKENMSSALSQADHLLEEVEGYIAQHDEDIQSDTVRAVSKQGERIVSAKSLLDEKKPDYLAAYNELMDAVATLQHLYRKAQEEHAERERLRREVASLQRELGSELARAQSAISRAGSDAPSSARSLLRDAASNQSPGGDLEDQVRTLRSAVNAAQDARRKADRAREEAEAEERRRRAAASAGAGYGASSSGFGSFGGFDSGGGGGGSSSWGSSGGGGGSSSW